MNLSVAAHSPRARWSPGEPLITLLILFFYILATAVMLFPLSVTLADHVPDWGDPLEHTWRIAWAGQTLIIDPLQLYQTNIFYPYPNTLAFSESQVTTVVSALPLLLATGNPILSFNFVFLASFALTGFTTYLLAYDLTRSRGGALIAGFAFAFWSYRFNHLSHIPLMTVQWLPLTIFALRRSLNQDRLVFPILFAVAFVLQVLSSWYSALMMVLLVGAYFVYLVLVHPAARNRRRLIALAVTFALALVPIVLVGLPYFQVSRELQFARTVGDAARLSATPSSFISVSSTNVLYHDVLPRPSGDALFAGALLLMFAAFGLRKKFKFPDRPFWIFAILFFAVIAFGPDMRLAPGLEFPSPLYRFLHEYVPGFQATRAPSRFFVGGMMGLVLIAANGFASLTAKFNSSARLLVTLAALVVLGGEYLAIPVRTSPIETGTALPAVYQWLQKQPPGNVVELPLAIGEVLPVTRSMYFSLYHRRSLPIAYASFLPPTQVDVLHTLNTALETPSPRVPNLLREFNVRYVIVNRGVENSAAVEAALGRAPGLESVYEDETNRVFRVTPEAPLHPLQFGCLAPQYAVPNAPYTLYLTAAHNRRYPVVNGELTPITVLVEWRQGDTAQATQSQTVRLPYVLPEREVGVPVTVNAPQSDGDVLVTCKLQDGTQIGESLPVRVVPDLQTGELPPPLELLAVRFGQEVSRESGEIVATFFWRRRTAVSDPLAMRARLVKDDGTVVSEVEREPVLYMHPVRLWHDNELVADSIALPIPPDTAPGEYRIEISVIDRRTGAPAVFRNLEGKPATGFSGQPLTLY